jgi:hypothetical protein
VRVVSREARFVGLEQIMYEIIVVAGRASSEVSVDMAWEIVRRRQRRRRKQRRRIRVRMICACSRGCYIFRKPKEVWIMKEGTTNVMKHYE